MSTVFEISTYEVMAARVVHDVFETMLRYEIQESSEEYSTSLNLVTSAIFFAGAWKGAVVLECSDTQCRLFTERLMGIPEPAGMNDDVRDAMGELVNTIGGNLKSVLPPGVSLSMPSSLEGSDYAYRICGSNQSVRFSFQGEAGPLWVTLVRVTENND